MSAESRFRLLVASYGALLLGPLPTLLVPRNPPIPGLSWLVLLGGFLVGGTVGYAVATRVAVVARISNVLAGSLVALLPLGYLVWLFALVANNPGKIAAHLLVRPTNAGILAFPVGLVAIHLALEAAADETATHAEFTARPAPRTRRLRLVSMSGGLGLVAGIGFSLYLNDLTSTVVLGALALAVVAILGVVFQTVERRVRIRDEGIEIDGQFTPWERVERVAVDGDTLAVKLVSRWTNDVKLDRGDITGFEEVEGALSRHVPVGTE